MFRLWLIAAVLLFPVIPAAAQCSGDSCGARPVTRLLQRKPVRRLLGARRERVTARRARLFGR
jgi:hypothetical protein